MLCEKLAHLGGSLQLSDGGTRVSVSLNDSSAIDDDTYFQPVLDYFQGRNHHDVNEPLVRNVMRVSGDTIEKLSRLGDPWITNDCYNDVDSYDMILGRANPFLPNNRNYREIVEHTWLQGGVHIAS